MLCPGRFILVAAVFKKKFNQTNNMKPIEVRIGQENRINQTPLIDGVETLYTEVLSTPSIR